MSKKRPTLTLIGLGAVLLLSALAVSAQVDFRFAQAQKENALALQGYEWKSRTEIIKDSETRKVQVVAMRYDSHGDLLKTPISSTSEPDLPTRGLRGLIAQKKKKSFILNPA